jgi:hypothetical protein
VALIGTVRQRTVDITLAVRLIGYTTVRRRQCLQIDQAALDQNPQMFHHFSPQFLQRRIIPDSHRVVRVASKLHGREPRMTIRRRECGRHACAAVRGPAGQGRRPGAIGRPAPGPPGGPAIGPGPIGRPRPAAGGALGRQNRRHRNDWRPSPGTTTLRRHNHVEWVTPSSVTTPLRPARDSIIPKN